MRENPVDDERHERRLGRVQALQLVPSVLADAPADTGVDDIADFVRGGIYEVLPRRYALRLHIDANHLITVVVDRVGPTHAEVRHRLGMDDHVPVRAGAARGRHEAGPHFGDRIAVGAIQERQGPAHRQGRADGADQDGDLLALGGRADQEAGLQVLRCVAAVRDRHRDDAGNRNGAHTVVDLVPAQE